MSRKMWKTNEGMVSARWWTVPINVNPQFKHAITRAHSTNITAKMQGLIADIDMHGSGSAFCLGRLTHTLSIVSDS